LGNFNIILDLDLDLDDTPILQLIFAQNCYLNVQLMSSNI